MSQANALEQLMLDLINKERASAGLAPLRFNSDLNEASEDHSDWMLARDVFSHTEQNGSSAGDRIQQAGYELEGSWTWGENIAWQSERGMPGLEDDVRDLHESLMNSPGHRANILDPDYDEIGIGIERGDFQNYDAVMVTQNFGATDATPEPTPPVLVTQPVSPTPTPATPVVFNPIEPAQPTLPDMPSIPMVPVVTVDTTSTPTAPIFPTTWNPQTPQNQNTPPLFLDGFTDVFDFTPASVPTLSDLLGNLLGFTTPLSPQPQPSAPITPPSPAPDLFDFSGFTVPAGLYDGFDIGA
jgi:hypothetical protein